MSKCRHAGSGCNYPEGVCLGVCMSGYAPVRFSNSAPIAPKPNHTVRRVATVLSFMCVGAVAAIYMHDYTLTLERENDALRALNMQLLRDQITGLECQPRGEDSKVIMQRIKGRLSCETHTIRKGI